VCVLVLPLLASVLVAVRLVLVRVMRVVGVILVSVRVVPVVMRIVSMVVRVVPMVVRVLLVRMGVVRMLVRVMLVAMSLVTMLVGGGNLEGESHPDQLEGSHADAHSEVGDGRMLVPVAVPLVVRMVVAVAAIRLVAMAVIARIMLVIVQGFSPHAPTSEPASNNSLGDRDYRSVLTGKNEAPRLLGALRGY
jgi:hypothetical protein